MTQRRSKITITSLPIFLEHQHVPIPFTSQYLCLRSLTLFPPIQLSYFPLGRLLCSTHTHTHIKPGIIFCGSNSNSWHIVVFLEQPSLKHNIIFLESRLKHKVYSSPPLSSSPSKFVLFINTYWLMSHLGSSLPSCAFAFERHSV